MIWGDPKRIVVVGAGGIGGWLIPPLAKLLESRGFKGEMYIVDGDKVEEKNTARQNFLVGDVGDYKAEVLTEIVQNSTSINAIAITDYLGKENAETLIVDGTQVIGGPDNHVCRRLIFDTVTKTPGCTALVAGNEKFDGNVMACFFMMQTNSPRQRHPEIWSTEDGDRSEMSCEEMAKLPGGEQTMAANIMAGNIILAILGLDARKVLVPFEVYFDAKNMKMAAYH